MTMTHHETDTEMRLELNGDLFGWAMSHGDAGWSAETERGDSAAPGFTRWQIRGWLFEHATAEAQRLAVA